MSDWHCEEGSPDFIFSNCFVHFVRKNLTDPELKSRADAINQNDIHGCLEQCYTWRRNMEPVCLSDNCSPLLPHVKKNFLLKSWVALLNVCVHSMKPMKVLYIWRRHDERSAIYDCSSNFCREASSPTWRWEFKCKTSNYETLHSRPTLIVTKHFFSDIPVYATDVEILQQMQMNVGLLSFSTRTLLR